ncbi:MAG: translation initiation factor IF-2B subunit delta [Methanoculleus sp. SDB]|nr:MAG: translation initiation factor IF-2B subunit delta [Methanoculleus sp. SDB]
MSLADTAEKIAGMEIRGAGRIARAGALALKAHAATVDTHNRDAFVAEMHRAADILLATRPTAVSLPNALHFVLKDLPGAATTGEARDLISRRADTFVANSEEALGRIAAFGARHIRDGDTIMTHCNSEAALACILAAHESGKEIEVFATEVRPRNQGLLTIRTLNDAGITTQYIVDSAARYFMNSVDLVIVGADAITTNGAVVNKIGTAQIALAAHEARTNVMVAAETYKFAPRTLLGELITIEERDPAEVLADDLRASLPRVRVRNPAFDVTPAAYIDLIVTEKGAIPPGLAYGVIREYLGWSIEEFQKAFE